MTVQYNSIQADIVDISQAAPLNSDCFLVDSNIWIWMTYSNAGHGEPAWRSSLMSHYAAFVQVASSVSKICCCGLSMAELAHTIEKTEREIYERHIGNSIKPKEYRHNLIAQRNHVVSEVQAAWAQVTSLADPLTLTVNTATTNAAIARCQSEKVDGYDLFILESMKNHGVVQVITDDGDFATVSGIQVFTVNRNVINAARSQGTLLRR